MSAPFATITGPIYNGDGQLLASGNVIFTRAVWDNVAGELVVKSRIVSRVVGGALSQDLVLTTGDAGVLWYATMEYLDVATGNTISDSLGRFALLTEGVTVPLVDIIGADDAPEPSVPDALAQCLAAAAQTSADRAATGEDREAAQADALRAEQAKDVALAGSPYRLPAFAALSRLTYGTATENHIRVVAGDVVDVPGVGTYQVAATGASDQHVTTAGGVKLYVLPDAGGYNVKAFGAIGDNVADDTAEIQAAINVAAAAKAAAYVPEGDYRITNTLTVPSNGNLIGENRNGSILRATDQTFVLVNITGSNAKVSRLFIRGGSVGVKTASNAAFFGQVIDCNIGYNRIGVELINTYIFLLKDNWICYNGWGVVTGALSFQVVVRDNIIDNNMGGGGFLCLANGGTIIVGNTIEGNRKEASPGGPSTGFGLWIVGLNQRTIVRDNWFEQNGNQDGSADVIISRPVEAWVDALVTDCVPAEYQSQLGTGAIITGQVNLEGSFFYATKRGVAIKLTGSSIGSISIANSTFTGIKGRNNIPVDLYGSGSARLTISENNITNTGDITIGAEMLNGVKRSYVYHTGTVPAFEVVTLDGKDLFTGYMTTREFAALTGATLDATSRVPSSGTSELKNGAVRALGGVNGCRVIQGTGRPRAGSTAWFGALSVPYYVVMLATGASAGFTFQDPSGFKFRAAQDSMGMAIIHPVTPIGAETTLHTGDYYGWAIITEADFNASVLKGCARLVVTDLDVLEKPMVSSVIPTLFATAAGYIWNVGDIVYNSAPAAGGNVGWVCTTAGSPGTWKAFGAIDA